MTDKAKVRIGPLITVGNTATEMAKVYRQMRRNQIDGQQGERLIRSLTALRQALEVSDLERRLDALEQKR